MQEVSHSRCESFSSLAKFGQCKAKYKFEYIDRIKIKDDSPALIRGRDTHKALEKKDFSQGIVKKGYQIAGISYPLRIKKISNLSGNLYTDERDIFLELPELEFGLGLDEGPEFNLRCLDFFDSTALFRGKIDLTRLILDKEKLRDPKIQSYSAKDLFLDELIIGCQIFDWKTGKLKNDKVQLKYYSLYAFAAYQRVAEVKCQNVFLDSPVEDQPKSFIVTREDTLTLIEDLQGKINRIKQETEFKPRPSGLCDFCVYKELCKNLDGGYNSVSLHSFNASIITVDGLLSNPFN